MKRLDYEPEKIVYALLENLEIASACSDCGRLSLDMLGGGICPHCKSKWEP